MGTWILKVIFLLSTSVARNPIQDYRSVVFERGSSVRLNCTNKTWSEMIYNIWNITISGKSCRITIGSNASEFDTCKDGKVLQNTTEGESYLYIPEFKFRDEGIYHCETSYWGGDYTADINVSARAAPRTSIRVDEYNSTRVAVCLAAGGKPAASISWRTTWNSSVTQSSILNSDGSYTVESHLVLPDNISTDNLTCDVMHPSLPVGHVELTLHSGSISWIWILLGLVFCIGVILSVSIVRLHPSKISATVRNGCKPTILTPQQPKTTKDEEDIEPYASYVQRDNSIYVSSAELFNP